MRHYRTGIASFFAGHSLHNWWYSLLDGGNLRIHLLSYVKLRADGSSEAIILRRLGRVRTHDERPLIGPDFYTAEYIVVPYLKYQ